MKKRWFAGAVVGVVAAGFFLLFGSTEGFVTNLQPIGDGQAVMALRSNDGTTSKYTVLDMINLVRHQAPVKPLSE